MTPETDAKASDIIGFFSCATVPAEFARKLERERDEAREDAHHNAARANANAAECCRAWRERNEAREDARLLAERLTRLELDSAFELAKLERERDEAREDATNFYAKIGELECERDEARALVDRLHVAFEGRCRATYEWYSTEASDVREAALRFLYPEQFK